MNTSRELPRVLGFGSVVGILVGTVIGSGIFIVPAAVAAQLGSPVLVMSVWLAGGVLTFFGALAFSELAAAYPQAGGMYVYLREAYGGLVSFLFGWALFLVIDSGSIATLAVGFSTKYLPQFVALSPAGSKAVSVLLIAILVTVNCLGVRYGAALQNVLTFIKFGAIVSVVGAVFLFGQGDTAHWTVPAAPPMSGALVGQFGLALVAVLWAYKGWEVATFAAGEIKNPERNLPLGLFLGSLSMMVLYIAANLAYLYMFPVEHIAGAGRIAADVMNAIVGPIGASLIAGVILCSIAGAANGNLLTTPRVFYAMARDGVFFSRLADVHPRALTPYVSIIALGAWSAILTLTGTFEQLYTYVIFGQWVFFGLTVGAVIVLRRTRPQLRRPYRTWGYPVTPIVFILAASFIAINAIVKQPRDAVAGAAIILLGVPAYLYWRKRATVSTTRA